MLSHGIQNGITKIPRECGCVCMVMLAELFSINAGVEIEVNKRNYVSQQVYSHSLTHLSLSHSNSVFLFLLENCVFYTLHSLVV